MAISKRLRFEILRRDGHTCRYCGRSTPEVKLTVDHVVPVALGGADDPTNLVAACIDCNAGKSSVAGDQQKVTAAAESAIRWADAIRLAADARQRERHQFDSEIASFGASWSEYSYEATETVTVRKPVPREKDWENSIKRFLALGVTLEAMDEFIAAAMSPRVRTYDAWRYFCGCCWKEVRRIQELAAASLEGRPAPTDATEPEAAPSLNDLP